MAMELKPAFLGVRAELLATLPKEDQKALAVLVRLADDKGIPAVTRNIFTRELKVLDTELGRKPENGGYPYVRLDEEALNGRISSVLTLARKLMENEDLEKAIAAKEKEMKAVARLPEPIGVSQQ